MKKALLGLAILAALAGSFGCQRISPKVEAAAAIRGEKPAPSPCSTDTDCEAQKAVHYCAGITKAGDRCRKHVKAEGGYCWMHKDQDKRKK